MTAHDFVADITYQLTEDEAAELSRGGSIRRLDGLNKIGVAVRCWACTAAWPGGPECCEAESVRPQSVRERIGR
jgi:hypothetical protein